MLKLSGHAAPTRYLQEDAAFTPASVLGPGPLSTARGPWLAGRGVCPSHRLEGRQASPWFLRPRSGCPRGPRGQSLQVSSVEGAPHDLLPEAALTPAASSEAPGCTLPSDRPPLVWMLLSLAAAKASSSDRQSRQGRLRCPAPGLGPGTALNTLPSLRTHRQPVPQGARPPGRPPWVLLGPPGRCGPPPPALRQLLLGELRCVDQSPAVAPPGGAVRKAADTERPAPGHRCPNRGPPFPHALGCHLRSCPVAPHELPRRVPTAHQPDSSNPVQFPDTMTRLKHRLLLWEGVCPWRS